MKKLITICLVLTFVSTSYGELISSWENDLEGWGFGFAVEQYSTSKGVTDGEYSLRLNYEDGGWMQSDEYVCSPAEIATLAANNQLSVDVTTNWSNQQAGWWMKATLVLNYAGGWTQSAEFLVNSEDDNYLTTPVFVDYDPTLMTDWAKITMIMNTGDGGFYYMDNLQATPEPATIALLGLGGLALIRKRK